MSQSEKKVFEKEELYEMFNTSFLPKLQEFGRRVKKEHYADKDLQFFEVNLRMQFSELDTPLTFQMVEDRLEMKMSPITQEDIDRSEADQLQPEPSKLGGKNE